MSATGEAKAEGSAASDGGGRNATATIRTARAEVARRVAIARARRWTVILAIAVKEGALCRSGCARRQRRKLRS